MRRQLHRAGLGLTALILVATTAAAQDTRTPKGLGGTAANRGAATMFATNPYFNPYLNPALTQGRMPGDAALLGLLSARDAAGAIGSGRMSGVRRGPNDAADANRPPARMPRTHMIPGASASDYFRRGPGRPESGGQRLFNARYGRYFSNNGHEPSNRLERRAGRAD
jgi:hypothetical protein